MRRAAMIDQAVRWALRLYGREAPERAPGFLMAVKRRFAFLARGA